MNLFVRKIKKQKTVSGKVHVVLKNPVHEFDIEKTKQKAKDKKNKKVN